LEEGLTATYCWIENELRKAGCLTSPVKVTGSGE
jgi:hypothetical protein